jgi:hypothetical protein
MGYAPTTDGVLTFTLYSDDKGDYDYELADPEGVDEFEIRAEVSIEYEAEPYEAPSRHSPGGGGLCGAGVDEVYSIEVDGEELEEEWELALVGAIVKRWANSHDDEVLDACESGLESSARDDFDPPDPYDYEPVPRYYDGTGRF